MNVIRAQEREKAKKEMRINQIREEARKKQELLELQELPADEQAKARKKKYSYDINEIKARAVGRRNNKN